MDTIIRKLYRYLTLRLLFPWQYRRKSRQPLKKNKAVFIESQLPELSDSLSVLYKRLGQEEGWELRVHCLQESFVSKRVFIRRAMRCLTDMADAEYIFLCDASRLVSCITPRQETVITQLWHGCGAFKKFGMSTAELIFGGTRAEYEAYPYYKNLDVVTVSSPEVAWAYEEAMCIPKDSGIVRAVGVSRTDVFFQDAFQKRAFERLKTLIPGIGNRKIILYAPTFRGNVSSAKAPDALDIAALADAFEENCVLLVKHHPVAENRPLIPERAKNFAFDVTDKMDIADLLCVSDFCISDYSSLIFEYSLFERPMIFFAYDLEDYSDWRGFYYDYNALTPGPVVRTTEEVIKSIRDLETRFDKTEVREFRKKFMGACDGHSTDRLIRLVTEKAEQKRTQAEKTPDKTAGKQRKK